VEWSDDLGGDEHGAKHDERPGQRVAVGDVADQRARGHDDRRRQ